MAVGDPECIGRRAVADDLAVNLARAGLGVLKFLKHQHPRPFADDEAVAIAVEGPAGLRGLVVSGRQCGQQNEAGHAERMDHAVGAAREHDVGAAVADHLVGLPDRLGAGRAGGQAVGVGPLAPKTLARWAGRRARLLLGLAHRVQVVRRLAGEFRRSRTLPDVRAVVEGFTNLGKSCWPSPAAQVNAEPGRVDGPAVLGQARIVHRHLSRGQGEPRVTRVLSPAVRRRPDTLSRSKSLTSAAIRVGNVRASKSEIGPTPLLPARSDDQVDSTSPPDAG